MSYIKTAMAIGLALALAGCSAMGSHSSYVDGQEPASWFKGDKADALKEGKENFRNNNYGLAEQKFRAAVETSPRNAEAWLGLAASYDQLGRFDLADRAYEEVIQIKGPLPQILNNRGYSYYLRGERTKALSILKRASKADPENRLILGNIDLLESENG